MERLPIEEILPELIATLSEDGLAVLQAPPGAGKTTRVPLALLKAGHWPGRFLVLEPRRLATRAAAERMAETLGEPVGHRVGYRMRGASKVSAATRIEVVTEGILTRMIQSDPELAGVSAILFDEFHERSLQADLGLALALEIRGALREDLALLVMSATLDAGPVAELMGGAKTISSQGRGHPIETRWLPRPLSGGHDFIAEATRLTQQAFDETEDGDLLAFLPGASEINRVAMALEARRPDAAVHPLYGALSNAAQDAALRPDPKRRKIVLATAIAETSLTIQGLRVVVDCGRARRMRFDPGSMMGRLVTERVTKAEADQRRGRAGREAPGVVYRMWAKAEDGALAAYPPPEIQSADLTPLALDLALWGARDTADLAFLDRPGPAGMAAARDLLMRLEAIDATGAVTEHGRAMAKLPVHPRLAHMLLRTGSEGAELAAYLDGARGAREEDLERALSRATSDTRRDAKRIARLVPAKGGLNVEEMTALAFPDRVARRRVGEQPRWVMVGGPGIKAERGSSFADAEWIVVTDSDGDPREARLRQAIAIAEDDVRRLFDDWIVWEPSVRWTGTRIEARRRERLGAVTLKEAHWPDAPEDDLVSGMIEGVRQMGLRASGAASRLMARAAAARAGGLEIPAMDEASLLAEAHEWLAPFLSGVTSADGWKGFDLLPALEARLGYEGRRALDAASPRHFETPLGRRVPIEYGVAGPEVSVKLQEVLGITRHPIVAGQPLRMTLLSPAGRPIQVTADLPGFWTGAYGDVRKDMRGRYPKHNWPEDPASAAPMAGTKRGRS